MKLYEVKFLGSRGAFNYFVECRERYVGEGEERHPVRYFNIIETSHRTDDEVYDYFTENYDYREEWKYRVAHDQEDCSYDAFVDYINENWRDYRYIVLPECTYDDIIARYNENVNEDYGAFNIEEYDVYEIKKGPEGYFIPSCLDDIEEDSCWENVDMNLWCEIKISLGECDFEYIKI